jgi:hypothetical protein
MNIATAAAVIPNSRTAHYAGQASCLNTIGKRKAVLSGLFPNGSGFGETNLRKKEDAY